ncbi:16S rRNA (guanine(527)-N(7))-methyltransferase RsmG [Mycoplasmoides alvi]|uniref:16S rRNA (guanine(527)-N(7))-methyltransferase RsmG n=1 Tax=Mycoplasmoides alvi TaxID=78580 RepID=UPI00051B6A7C|nr:16S rRNA (guanine(527)-N(7))-methyltransferase RsmG [Mycoplasmoides alvi]
MQKNNKLLAEKYVNLIFEFNQKFNLTGFKNKEDINSNLILDTLNSIVFLNDNIFKINKIIDIGSGNGIPGIVIAIFYPNILVTLVEANKKKCLFLQKVINELNLKNVNIISKRAENLDFTLTENFDLGISRAVGSISIMNELFCRWIKQGKYILHLKSLNFEKEILNAEPMLNELGLVFLKNEIISLKPKLNVNVWFQKIKKTASKFPRSWKEIKFS